MQLSGPHTCPHCSDGKKPSGKLCATCLGSGRVYFVPAERPIDPEIHRQFQEMLHKQQKDIFE